MKITSLSIKGHGIPVYSMNTVIVGSGAASLSTADHCANLGQPDIAIVTEKIGGGTSSNTGSDKQTYYKLSVCGSEPDSPGMMAQSLYDGGSMHGDIALIESLLSIQSFYRLVQAGVPFPHNKFGGFAGYKTDHDPKQRATSAGPWTSQQMFACLLREVKKKNIPIFNGFEVVAILNDGNRACGIAALDKNKLDTPSYGLTLFFADNVVFGVGGPGGLYKTSVYPSVHTGAIGLALEIGAKAANLTESQFGLASTKFRWNVSGTYQQVIPSYISTDQNGGDVKPFLNPYFKNMGRLATDIFLKGYQWPFDPRKISDYGSSLIDILVYIETVVHGRRVFMDFRENPRGGNGVGSFDLNDLEPEAFQYLEKSQALFGLPIDRLKKMNPMAIELYKSHGIYLEKEPLEIAVCAQHNNGGLAADIWWESNIRHLFPVGEVNGSHGVYRPGGSALNSGQVGSLRAAQRITKHYTEPDFTFEQFKTVASEKSLEILNMLDGISIRKDSAETGEYRCEFQKRMTDEGSHIRKSTGIVRACEDAERQFSLFEKISISGPEQIPDLMKNRHLCFSHIAYLEAIRFYLESGGGSRGSYMVLDEKGESVIEGMLPEWKFKPEEASFRSKVLETVWNKNKKVFEHSFADRRPIPDDDSWFENVWSDFSSGKIFGS